MSTSSTVTRRARSDARGTPQPLSPRSLGKLPTEVLRLHLANKCLITTGTRAALVRRLRGYLRSTGADGGPHASGDSDGADPSGSGLSDNGDGSDPSGPGQSDDPGDHASPSGDGGAPPAGSDSGESTSSGDESDGGVPPPPRRTPRPGRRLSKRSRRASPSSLGDRRPSRRSCHASPGSPGDRHDSRRSRHAHPSRRSRRVSPGSPRDRRPSRRSRHVSPGSPGDRHPPRYTPPGTPWGPHPSRSSRYASPGSPGDHHPHRRSRHVSPGSPGDHRPPRRSGHASPGSPRDHHRLRPARRSHGDPLDSSRGTHRHSRQHSPTSSDDSSPHRRSRKRRRPSSTSSSGTPSTSPSPHHHRRRHRRRDSSDDSFSWTTPSSISCAPPLPRHLTHRIRGGKYVKFDRLLLPPDSPPVPGFGPTKPKTHRSAAKRKVSDLASWLEAWNRFLCTRLTSHPALALELAKYQTLVVMLFAHYSADACLRYDQLFRMAASQDTSLRWDTLKEDIYVWSFTRHSSPLSLPRPPTRQPTTTVGQPFRMRPTATSQLGPPTQGTAQTPTRATLTASGCEICRRYNYEQCTRGDECFFAHECWTPGCHRPHPGKGCPRRAT